MTAQKKAMISSSRGSSLRHVNGVAARRAPLGWMSYSERKGGMPQKALRLTLGRKKESLPRKKLDRVSCLAYNSLVRGIPPKRVDLAGGHG